MPKTSSKGKKVPLGLCKDNMGQRSGAKYRCKVEVRSITVLGQSRRVSLASWQSSLLEGGDSVPIIRYFVCRAFCLSEVVSWKEGLTH